MSQADEGSRSQSGRENSAAGHVRSPQAGMADAATFVERETRRRKRLLRFYLALLIIPVALAIVVLVFGRSDRRVVMDEIREQAPPIVQRELGERIEPTIRTEVQKQITQPLEQIDSKINEVAQSKASREEVTKTVEAGNESLRNEINSKFVQPGVSREEFNRLLEENKSLRNELNNVKSNLEEKFQALQKRVIILSEQTRIPQ